MYTIHGFFSVHKNACENVCVLKGPIVNYLPGGAVVLEGGTILNQAPFWGVNFSLVRTHEGGQIL